MIRSLCVAAVVLALGFDATAEPSYPSRPIKVLHGFPAGGPPDIVLRRIATELEQRLGQPVVVENRPGASGTIAAAAVARAVPDGYTLLFGVAANVAVAPAVMKKPPYDPTTAFTPIVEVARGPYVWLVRADAPVTTMPQFVAWAKGASRTLNYASPGAASVHHLGTEILKRSTGIELVHVPYTSGIYPALLGGHVDAMFESMPGPLPHIGAGKLRALAVTGRHRLRALPDVPTLVEQGLPDVDVNSWWGVVGPRGVPEPIVTTLNRAIAGVLAAPAVRTALEQMSIEPTPGTAEAFGAYVAQEYERWRREAHRLDVHLD